jgi:hypothetical protein
MKIFYTLLLNLKSRLGFALNFIHLLLMILTIKSCTFCKVFFSLQGGAKCYFNEREVNFSVVGYTGIEGEQKYRLVHYFLGIR